MEVHRNLYGVWELRVHGDVDWSPVPIKAWNQGLAAIPRWRLHKGDFMIYGGWLPEIQALVDTGQVTAEFLHGWSWATMSRFLEPWVDELMSYRHRAEELKDTHAAALLKMIVNAAIGRWGMDGTGWAVIPGEEADIHTDLPMEMSREASTEAPLMDVWVRKTQEEALKTRPYHWISWVRSSVRMELWKQFMYEIQRGNKPLAANFDSLILAGEPHVRPGQEPRPFVWRKKELHSLSVPYNRAVVAWENGVPTVKMPGVPRELRQRGPISDAMRLAILVDHQRKREQHEKETNW